MSAMFITVGDRKDIICIHRERCALAKRRASWVAISPSPSQHAVASSLVPTRCTEQKRAWNIRCWHTFEFRGGRCGSAVRGGVCIESVRD